MGQPYNDHSRTVDYIEQEIARFIDHNNYTPAELHIGVRQYHDLIRAYQLITQFSLAGNLFNTDLAASYRGIPLFYHKDKFSYFELIGGANYPYTGETTRLD